MFAKKVFLVLCFSKSRFFGAQRRGMLWGVFCRRAAPKIVLGGCFVGAQRREIFWGYFIGDLGVARAGGRRLKVTC